MAAEAVSAIRRIVNVEPLLATVEKPKVAKAMTKDAMKEQRRRDTQRKLFERLSKYYTPDNGKWQCAELLSAGEHGSI